MSASVTMEQTGETQHLKMPEVEFLAEESLVYIIPNFEAEHFRFIAGDVGPFRPQRPIAVPLWLASMLRSRQKCKVTPPEWLSKEYLAAKLEEERQLDKQFSEMPDYFQEVAAVLFECAAEDIPDSEAVRVMLADIYDLRYSKMRSGLASAHESEAIQMNNLSHMEISSIRPFFTKSLDAFFVLNAGVDEAAYE